MNSFRDACCWRLMEYFKSAEFEWGCVLNRRWGANIAALPKQTIYYIGYNISYNIGYDIRHRYVCTSCKQVESESLSLEMCSKL
jgi:hypothetical protein